LFALGRDRQSTPLPRLAETLKNRLSLVRAGFVAALQARELAFEAEMKVTAAAGARLESDHLVSS
jgi:hypothetical protein